jgi:phosphotriesterase-related protein
MTSTHRQVQRGQVQTVLGPIEPDELGPTLMHEHLLCDIRHPSPRRPEALGPALALDNVWAINYGTAKRAARNLLLDARDMAADEVGRMLAAGGRSVVVPT